jgi:hypothetical protein
MPDKSKNKHQHTDKQELKRTTHTDNKKFKRTADKSTKTDNKAKPHIGKPRGPVGDKTKYFRPKGQPEVRVKTAFSAAVDKYLKIDVPEGKGSSSTSAIGTSTDNDIFTAEFEDCINELANVLDE